MRPPFYRERRDVGLTTREKRKTSRPFLGKKKLLFGLLRGEVPMGLPGRREKILFPYVCPGLRFLHRQGGQNPKEEGCRLFPFRGLRHRKKEERR